MTESSLDPDLRLLIVDDDLVFLELIDGLLRSLGLKNIERADNGLNAHTYLASLQQRVDCIICDLHMPNGNGLQLLKDVRTAAFKLVRPDACFIMLTAIKHPGAVKLAGQLDVNGYITKPVTAESLKAGILRARSRFFALSIDRYWKVTVPGDSDDSRQ